MGVRALRKSWDEKMKERKNKEMLIEYQKEIRDGLAAEKKVGITRLQKI